DLRGAAELWREALAKAPDDVRARAYVAWAEACEGGQVDSLAVRVAQRYPSDDDVAAVLSTALEVGLIGAAPASEEDPAFRRRRRGCGCPSCGRGWRRGRGCRRGSRRRGGWWRWWLSRRRRSRSPTRTRWRCWWRWNRSRRPGATRGPRCRSGRWATSSAKRA